MITFTREDIHFREKIREKLCVLRVVSGEEFVS
jgi:hypothetical protein